MQRNFRGRRMWMPLGLAVVMLMSWAGWAQGERARGPTSNAIEAQSLASLYSYLNVPAPMGGLAAEEALACPMDWVVWSPPQSGDPTAKICLGRWRATNSDRCRDVDRCSCETYKTCTNGRIYTDACMASGEGCECMQSDGVIEECNHVDLFRTNVSTWIQEVNQRARCRSEAAAAAAALADGGPTHVHTWDAAGGGYNFICKAQYAAAAPRTGRLAECGCEQVAACECSREEISTAAGFTQAQGQTALVAQIDRGEDVLEEVACETLQNQSIADMAARYEQLEAAAAAVEDEVSRGAMEATQRLMAEFNMVSSPVETLLGSTQEAPACGMSDWRGGMTASCAQQIAAGPGRAAQNCARLVSSHVAASLHTQEVFDACIEELRTVLNSTYSSPACTQEVRNQGALLACQLLKRFSGSDPSTCQPAPGGDQ